MITYKSFVFQAVCGGLRCRDIKNLRWRSTNRPFESRDETFAHLHEHAGDPNDERDSEEAALYEDGEPGAAAEVPSASRHSVRTERTERTRNSGE